MVLSNARKFFPVVTGNTVGSHNQIVDQLKKKGVKDVQKIEDCDFTLAFCPVVSRLGTDLEAAMQVIPVGKPVILVVLHHTFDEDAIVPESSRLVTRSDVLLTVDFLFFETRGLLRCNKNDISLQRICDKLKLTKSIPPGPPIGGHQSADPGPHSSLLEAPPSGFYSRRWLCNNQLSILHLVIIVVSCILVAALILWGIIYASEQKEGDMEAASAVDQGGRSRG